MKTRPDFKSSWNHILHFYIKFFLTVFASSLDCSQEKKNNKKTGITTQICLCWKSLSVCRCASWPYWPEEDALKYDNWKEGIWEKIQGSNHPVQHGQIVNFLTIQQQYYKYPSWLQKMKYNFGTIKQNNYHKILMCIYTTKMIMIKPQRHFNSFSLT